MFNMPLFRSFQPQVFSCATSFHPPAIYVCPSLKEIVMVIICRFCRQFTTVLHVQLKLGNACYYSVQNLLSSRLLSKKLKIKIYRTIILPFVLYGCETWSLTLREERRLRVFQNRVLRRVFGPKMDEVTGEWRKLHNDELSDL